MNFFFFIVGEQRRAEKLTWDKNYIHHRAVTTNEMFHRWHLKSSMKDKLSWDIRWKITNDDRRHFLDDESVILKVNSTLFGQQ